MFFFLCVFVTLKSGMIWWWSGNCFSPQYSVKNWIRSCLMMLSDVPIYRGGCQDFTTGTLVFHPIFPFCTLYYPILRYCKIPSRWKHFPTKLTNPPGNVAIKENLRNHDLSPIHHLSYRFTDFLVSSTDLRHYVSDTSFCLPSNRLIS